MEHPAQASAGVASDAQGCDQENSLLGKLEGDGLGGG